MHDMKNMKNMKNMKKDKKLSDAEMAAKKNVLSSLRDQASEAMGDKLKKVTVAAPSVKGLEKGLEKAKEIVEGKDPLLNEGDHHEQPNEMDGGDAGDNQEDNQEYHGDEESEEDMSLEEVNAKLEELMKMKKMLEEQENQKE